MRKTFLFDLLSLFFIAIGYMLIITLILFSFDFLEIQTTGSSFLETLSTITIFQFFNHDIFNGLFTLFLIVSFLLFLYKTIELYQKNKWMTSKTLTPKFVALFYLKRITFISF